MSGLVTIIIGQAVRPDHEDDFVRWQHEVTEQASQFPGYLSSELSAPTSQQSDWTVIYRFDSVVNARNWLDSGTHQELLDRAAPYFSAPGTRQFIADSSEVGTAVSTLVATNRVPPDKVDQFLAWHSQVADTQRTFPGFRGVDVFRPVEGLQEDWTIRLKFDTTEHLDAWLNSAERSKLLKSSPVGDFELRRIDHTFGNWFSLGDQPAEQPSNIKTSIAVWLGLYPTVTFLTLLTMPLHLPLWVSMLIGNLLSSIVMSYVTMPLYSNPILGWWLRPKRTARQPRTNLLGIAAVLAINAVWALFFFVLTTHVLRLR